MPMAPKTRASCVQYSVSEALGKPALKQAVSKIFEIAEQLTHGYNSFGIVYHGIEIDEPAVPARIADVYFMIWRICHWRIPRTL
jgi:hypothetical protein